MPKTSLIALCSAIIFAFSAAIAHAQETTKGQLTVHNNTEGNVVIGLYTNGGKGWSTNWLETELMPNETTQLILRGEDELCDQLLQLGWLGANKAELLDEPQNVDLCTVTEFYLTDSETYFN